MRSGSMTEGPANAGTIDADASERLRATLERLLPADALLTSPADCLPYGYDNSRLHSQPGLVALPGSADDVQAIIAACVETRMPVVVRGRGTNTTGASVPVAGGLVLSCERLRRILAIDPANRVAVVEPGVLNGDLQRAAAGHGLFWPPDPTSRDYCTIGGNLACNAGGPRAVKYGASRDNTLGIDAVTGRAEVIVCGGATTKGATGYDLTRLLVGSEGTLAVITRATLRLLPRPSGKATLRALFDSVQSAALAVARIMSRPHTPCALEFMDRTALALARAHGADAGAGDALLLIEVDGSGPELAAALDAVSAAAAGEGLLSLDHAEGEADVAALWSARRALSPALRSLSPRKINEDVVVPVARLPELIDGVEAIAERHGVQTVCFGHAGNGNIHVNLLPRAQDAAQDSAAAQALDDLFNLVIELGGTLSGEHGIGIAKRDWMTRALSPATLACMRAIKREFDPYGILNPGKLLPD